MTVAKKPPRLSATHHEHLVRPQHTNAHGTTFGGEVMAWVDIAAAAAAMRHAGTQVVTASIDSLHFLAPIPMGWLALLDAQVNFAWRTSMEVEVRVSAYDPTRDETRHTVDALLTFVALGPDGKPVAIPQVEPETAAERARAAAAAERRQQRLAVKGQSSSGRPS